MAKPRHLELSNQDGNFDKRSGTFAIWSMSNFFGKTLPSVASGVMMRPLFNFFASPEHP